MGKHKKGGNIYTYLLKDEREGLIKIGKTSVPQNRFNTLCTVGKVYPIVLLLGDIEKELHERFKDVRVDHPDTHKGGYTEYFKLGGKLDKFIEEHVEDVPFIGPAQLGEAAIKKKLMVSYSDPGTMWDFNKSVYGTYFIGIALLKHVNAITDSLSPTTIEVSNIENKVAMTSGMYNKLLNYRVLISDTKDTEGHKRIDLRDSGVSVYILVL